MFGEDFQGFGGGGGFLELLIPWHILGAFLL